MILIKVWAITATVFMTGFAFYFCILFAYEEWQTSQLKKDLTKKRRHKEAENEH